MLNILDIDYPHDVFMLRYMRAICRDEYKNTGSLSWIPLAATVEAHYILKYLGKK